MSQVRYYDNPFRFLVQSKSRPDETHLVDITAHGMNGECSCEHFSCKCLPALTSRKRQHRHRCSHITAAFDFIAAEYIKAVESQKTSPNHE